MWLGSTPMSIDLMFSVPESMASDLMASGKEGSAWRRVGGQVLGRASAVWFTSLEHNRRHEALQLMTEGDNIRYGRTGVKGVGYRTYDNYDAIEVPYTESIPSDYGGVMGVPITFLGKYNPDQFEIVGLAAGNIRGLAGIPTKTGKDGPYIDGKLKYGRVLIRHRKATN
jgi:hypothetical protein